MWLLSGSTVSDIDLILTAVLDSEWFNDSSYGFKSDMHDLLELSLKVYKTDLEGCLEEGMEVLLPVFTLGQSYSSKVTVTASWSPCHMWCVHCSEDFITGRLMFILFLSCCLLCEIVTIIRTSHCQKLLVCCDKIACLGPQGTLVWYFDVCFQWDGINAVRPQSSVVIFLVVNPSSGYNPALLCYILVYIF